MWPQSLEIEILLLYILLLHSINKPSTEYLHVVASLLAILIILITALKYHSYIPGGGSPVPSHLPFGRELTGQRAPDSTSVLLGLKLVAFPMSWAKEHREQHRKEKAIFPHQERLLAANMGSSCAQHGI